MEEEEAEAERRGVGRDPRGLIAALPQNAPQLCSPPLPPSSSSGRRDRLPTVSCGRGGECSQGGGAQDGCRIDESRNPMSQTWGTFQGTASPEPSVIDAKLTGTLLPQETCARSFASH